MPLWFLDSDFVTLLDMASLDPLNPMTSQAQFVTSILVCFLDAMNSPSFLSLVLPLVSIFRWAERGQAHKRCRAGIVSKKSCKLSSSHFVYSLEMSRVIVKENL